MPGDADASAQVLDDRAGEACTEYALARSCGDAVVQYCDIEGGATMLWGACIEEAELECELDDNEACGESGTRSCDLVDGEPAWGECWDQSDGGSTPLVLVLPGATLEYEPARTAAFDIAGGCLSQDWPSASTPWLALDLDGNGSIDDGRELFGSGTVLRSGRRAEHGFAALAELDANGDGVISAEDPRFAELVLWADHDGDRRSNHSEHTGLLAAGVLSIPVAFDREVGCDDRGNCGIERASVSLAQGQATTAQIVDVHLACQ